MKKFYSFFFFVVFCNVALADEGANFGIVREIIEEEDYVENPGVNLRNHIVVDTRFDDNYQSTNRKDEFKETQGGARLFSQLNFAKHFYVNSFIRVKKEDNISATQRRNNAANGGGDRSFENIGLFVEELNLKYETKDYALLAGKFNINYGTAWRWDRGIWIQDIAENYRQREKLGFNAILRAGDVKKTGRYNLSAAFFTNDNKYLDNSLLVQRNSTRKTEGVPGDKKGLSSFIASLDVNFDFGEKFGEKEKLSYHFSYLNLGVNSKSSPVNPTKVDNQKNFVAGMNYAYPLIQNISLDGLLEYQQTKSLNGNSDIGEDYLTANLITKLYHNWSVLLGYANRRQFQITQNGFDQTLSEISLGYEFEKNSFFDKLTLQAGYKNQRTNYKTSIDSQNAYGFLVRYYKNF